MSEKEDLQAILTDRFDRFDEKFDDRFDKLHESFGRFKSLVVSFFGLIILVLLAMIGGAFTFTSRVDNDQQSTSKQVDENTNALGIVIGVSNDAHGGVVLEDLDNKYNPTRGKK